MVQKIWAKIFSQPQPFQTNTKLQKHWDEFMSTAHGKLFSFHIGHKYYPTIALALNKHLLKR